MNEDQTQPTEEEFYRNQLLAWASDGGPSGPWPDEHDVRDQDDPSVPPDEESDD